MIASAGVGGGFGGVLGYVLDEKKGAEVVHQQELLAQGEERALLLDEMRMCAEQNLRCTRPVYHLSLSWAPEDHPTPEQVVATAQRFLLDLGLQEHQALVVRHHDTAHEHVHIVVNRVHPDTGKTWKAGLHRRRLPPICRRVERDMGWRIVPSERGHDQALPTAREQTAERKRGVEPLAKRIQQRVWGALIQCQHVAPDGAHPEDARLRPGHGWSARRACHHRRETADVGVPRTARLKPAQA